MCVAACSPIQTFDHLKSRESESALSGHTRLGIRLDTMIALKTYCIFLPLTPQVCLLIQVKSV